MADQLWLMKHIQEEEEDGCTSFCSILVKLLLAFECSCSVNAVVLIIKSAGYSRLIIS